MLEHARTGTGPRQLIDINTLVVESLRLAYQGLCTKDKAFTAVLTTDFDPALPPLAVLPQDLSRVLINLFTNALQALQQRLQQWPDPAYRPEVTATTQAVPNGVAIRIRDNGTGMSVQVQAKIFQPFFTTKTVGQGTGLGLSLSHDIVTTGHGGTLLCESEEGTGTEFIITLPLQRAGTLAVLICD